MWTKARIIAEIQRTAAENGGNAVSERRIRGTIGLRKSDWFGKYWTRWSEAQQEAGFEPTAFRDSPSFTDREVIESVAQLTRQLGFFPREVDHVRAKSEDASSPGLEAVKTRLGFTKAERVAAVRNYASTIVGYSDVVAICDSELASVALEPRAESDVPGADGFVYLVRSGKFYKIGRSNAVGRREYEIALQMPEPVRTVHRIMTDDPPGIEAYWHRRFAAKRKNGEWFDLDAADVAAFRRRKFM